ncbi:MULTISPECIES: MFS transporter [Actinomadura]|uniref:MFS transporter n=1 Tax=Actinomadura yumaensis TaxID=111807 RepID=A0ABW2CSH8_9ACTN|nr:MFS transporter [Actinomadura sp. J1-007]
MPDVPVPRPIAGRARSLALAVVLIAAFIDLIGVTILQVVLPAIREDLDASPAQLQWMLGGYTLALALGMVSGARLGDMLGHKRMFVAGIAAFVVTSALCAAAPGAGLLVAARILQGLSAAAMIPQVLSQIQVMYAPRERGGPMAAFSALTGLAATLGPLLGPLMLRWDLAGQSWRMVFWVNVPLGALAFVASLRLLPDSRTAGAPRVDVPGAVLSSLGLLLVLYPLINAADRASLPGWAYVSIAAGAAVLAAFVAYERRLGSRGGAPLLETSLFRFRSVNGGLLVQLLFFVPTMGFFMVFMLFLQIGLGMSATRAGLMILPWCIAVPVFATLSAAVLLPRIGRVTVQIGLVVMAAGWALLAVQADGATHGTAWTDLVWGVLVGGAGMGMLVAPLAQLTLDDVPVTDAGSGSALYNTVTQLAAAVGVAVVGTYFFTEVRDTGRTAEAMADGYGEAFSGSLWLGIGLLAVALAATPLLPRHPGRTAAAEAPRPEEPADA